MRMPRRTTGSTGTRQHPAPSPEPTGPAPASTTLTISAILAAICAALLIWLTRPSTTTTTTTAKPTSLTDDQCSPPKTTILTGRCKGQVDADKFCQHTMSCTVLDEKHTTKWIDFGPEVPLVTEMADLETVPLPLANTWLEEEEDSMMA